MAGFWPKGGRITGFQARSIQNGIQDAILEKTENKIWTLGYCPT